MLPWHIIVPYPIMNLALYRTHIVCCKLNLNAHVAAVCRMLHAARALQRSARVPEHEPLPGTRLPTAYCAAPLPSFPHVKSDGGALRCSHCGQRRRLGAHCGHSGIGAPVGLVCGGGLSSATSLAGRAQAASGLPGILSVKLRVAEAPSCRLRLQVGAKKASPSG